MRNDSRPSDELKNIEIPYAKTGGYREKGRFLRSASATSRDFWFID